MKAVPDPGFGRGELEPGKPAAVLEMDRYGFDCHKPGFRARRVDDLVARSRAWREHNEEEKHGEDQKAILHGGSFPESQNLPQMRSNTHAKDN